MDLWEEPTRVIPRETAAELMRSGLRTARAAHAPIPMRPADLTETREIPIPPELLTATL